MPSKKSETQTTRNDDTQSLAAESSPPRSSPVDSGRPKRNRTLVWGTGLLLVGWMVVLACIAFGGL